MLGLQPDAQGGRICRIDRERRHRPPLRESIRDREAITGTPAAIASSAGRPNPSSNDGMRKNLRASEQLGTPVLGDVTEILHVARQRRRLDLLQPRTRVRSGGAGHHQTGRIGRRASSCAYRVEQPADILSGIERAHKQQVAHWIAALHL